MSKKISIIIPRYTIAGVPLAQIRLAKAFSYYGYNVELLIGYVENGSKLPLLENISILHFNKKKVRNILFPLILYLIKNKPALMFSAEDHLNICVSIAAMFSLSNVKLSCSSRVTPYDTYSNKIFSKRWFLKYLNKFTSWRVNVLTCVSEDMVYQYYKIFKNKKYICIYNIVDDHQSRNLMKEKTNHKWINNKKNKIIIAAGKLAYWKGFENLIKSFSIVNKKTNAKLIILGDGPEREKLETLISSLNLNKFISLPGYVANPLSYFSKSDVFVLSSLVEGMPNVLVEAMMCGCTPVSTDCPTGPKELLKSNKYGYLVPVNDKYKMATAIIKALEKPISQKLLKEAIKPFNENTVLEKHLRSLHVY